jgi:branched-chain amino acid transport system substrate-binding protein
MHCSLRLITAGLALAFAHGGALAQVPNNRIKVGILNDMVGPVSDVAGPGSVLAAQLAVEEHAKSIIGDVTVEIIQADHQNKADVAASIARRWLDTEGVNAILDVPFSAAALAVHEVVRNNARAAFLVSGGGTVELTGPKCSPNTVHWTYDTWSVGHSTAKAVVRTGAKSWFFITSDFAFGHSLEAEATKAVQSEGGRVLGAVRHPFNAADMSSFVLQAQASKAEVIGLANSSIDTINAIKQAREFGVIAGGQKVAAMIMLINDVHGLGLDVGEGLYLTEAFYWDMNERTRAFSQKFAARSNGRRPSMIQAGVYASLLHYMKAVKAANTTDGLAVVRKMKELPTDDPLFGKGSVRADGRKIHDMHLFQVKARSESKGPWDYYKLVHTVPAVEAFRPLSEGGCPLVKG